MDRDTPALDTEELMDRYLRLLSPPQAVALAVVALACLNWLPNPCGEEPPAASQPPAVSVAPATPALLRAPNAATNAPRRLSTPAKHDWLPALTDDTRTVLTEFSLEHPAIVRTGGPLLQTVSGSETGPQLRSAGSMPERPMVQEPALWYPETALPPQVEQQSPRLLIAPPEAYGQRSQNLELMAREADMHTRRGFELAGRGAYFSARAEFIAALRLLAQGLDAERHTRLHSTTLGAGLCALKEAEDFLPSGSQIEADLDLAGIIAGHRTPVLKNAAVEGLTPLSAMQSYLTFGQEQLGAAADREVAGSMALYALGKLHKAISEQQAVSVPGARAKAMVFYQAALLVYPQNHMASNELGVLLAQGGRCEDARVALEHSLAIQQTSAGWHNLAVVYQQLGKGPLAYRAEQLAQRTRQAESAHLARYAPGVQQPVRWVNPQTFAQTTGQGPQAGPPVPTRTPANAPANAPANTPGVAGPTSPAQPSVARSPFSLLFNQK